MGKNSKVLILGQPFNDITGGGITLSNLFKGWPRDKIAVAATGHMLYSVTTNICDTYYQLGKEEHKWMFPFNLIQRSFPSGLKTFESTSSVINIRHISRLRYEFVNHFFYPVLSWLGLFHCVSSISLSDRFKEWLNEYNPDVLYIQVSSRETILFAKKLIEYLHKPAAIHFMDDWPSTISNKGLFKNYWKRRIEAELKLLLGKIDLHLSISNPMSEEYERRYGKKFIAFHNPIDLDMWLPFSKTNFAFEKEYIKVLYSGRIGVGIASSLIEVASAIDLMNEGAEKIKLHIQTPTEEQSIVDMLQSHKCVIINPIAEYRDLPGIFSDADILLLANDFNGEGVAYLKFSMPTKASEYMISGTPVLVYAPEEAAVSKLFSQNECAYCLYIQDTEEIIKSIRYLISNEEFREKISRNSVTLAKEIFDAEKVRNKFQNLLINLSIIES
jgi:glycosyltransferase involved in cell wall biosynthesis